MGAFGGLILTNKGRNLQVKVQTGVPLQFSRIAIGDGSLGGASILELNALISEKKSLDISKLKVLTEGKAVVGAVLSNKDITSGFYFREIGVFANDPDVGEILYCYGNAGTTADYIPAGSEGSSDLIEKSIDVITIVGNAANVTATINSSLVFETLDGAREKANQAEANAKAYSDEKLNAHQADFAYQIPTIIDSQIRLNKLSGTDRLFFRLDSDLEGNITISTDGGLTELPLVDFEENQITLLEKGFVEVVADTDFFTLRNRGLGGVDKQALIDIVNEAEQNESDLREQFVNEILIKDPNAGIDSDSTWLEVLNALTSIGERASGNITIPGTYGTGTVTVSSLNFTPSKILLYLKNNGSNFDGILGFYDSTSNINVIWHWDYSGTSFKYDNSKFSIIENGFKINYFYPRGSTNAMWIAIK